jgi:hypothetical protein
VAPTADFSFNYDPGDPAVTVTHSGGDNIRADEIAIRGENLATGSYSNANWYDNATNSGNADASGSIEGQSAIVSGDSWEVDVSGGDYILRVVWESSAGDTSSELAVDRGPDA